MSSQKIILFICGAFNPPTIMHLRIFELAKDYLSKIGGFHVIGGILSPVHDRYGKKDLASAHHRIQMTNLAVKSNPFLRVSTWECEEENWTRTRAVLDYHQNQLDNYVHGTLQDKLPWMPDVLTRDPVKLKLCCGADVLESFNVPNLWAEDDMKTLAGDYGIVVISRDTDDPRKAIYKSDILSRFEGNIHIAVEWISNAISSTKIRCAIRRNESVKYFVPDPVIEYLVKEGVYTKPVN